VVGRSGAHRDRHPKPVGFHRRRRRRHRRRRRRRSPIR
jgi:hypothetical protein